MRSLSIATRATGAPSKLPSLPVLSSPYPTCITCFLFPLLPIDSFSFPSVHSNQSLPFTTTSRRISPNSTPCLPAFALVLVRSLSLAQIAIIRAAATAPLFPPLALLHSHNIPTHASLSYSPFFTLPHQNTNPAN